MAGRPSRDAAAFQEGEEVLAHHGPCLYVAKVVKVAPAESDPNQYEYRVHYLKWNKSWDEWVAGNRLLKKTPANLIKMNEIESQVKDTQKGRRSGKPSLKKRRLSTDAGIENRDDNKDEVAGLAIPKNLKASLISDWEAICKKKTLISLPASASIDSILDDYLQSKSSTKRSPEEEKDVTDVVNGIRVYFERSLQTRLLYDLERPQYTSLTTAPASADRPLTSIYGVQHLLRLFVLLPGLMAHSAMESIQRQKLMQKLTPILKYISKHLSSMISKDYEPMSPEYLSQLECDVDDTENKQP